MSAATSRFDPPQAMPFGMSEVNALARHTTWAHSAVTAWAGYGIGLFALLLLAGVWQGRRTSARTLAAAGWAGAGALFALSLNQPLVHLIDEARPYERYPQLLVLAHRSTDASFPSDHAVIAGAVAAGLWLVDRRLGVVASVAAVLMAFARTYTAAHYPQDVLAGLVLGVVVVVLGWRLVGRRLTNLLESLASTPLRPLLRAGAAGAGPANG